MKKPDYYYNQSAVIPFRIKSKGVEILLITSRKKKKWIIPKGIVEPDLLPGESAAKEAIEEAGIKGKVSEELLGEYKQEKWGGICNIKVYSMEVILQLEKWAEDFRRRKWVSIEEALVIIDNHDLKSILKEFGNSLNANGYKTLNDK